MILLSAEKAPDILASIASRALVLSLHDGGSLRIDRDTVRASTPTSGVLGFQAEDGRIVGITSYSQAVQHSSVRFYVHFETDDRTEIKSGLLLLQKLASSCGAVKLSVVACQDQDGMADIARELGLLPEVKMRQHVYSRGQYFAATEYGCIL
jgi:DUF971 family protein